jgi:acyl-CoA hydrolase
MKEHKRSTYQIWLLVFGIAFLLSFVLGLFGEAGIVRNVIQHHEVLQEELFTVIEGGIIALVNAVLAVAALILSRRIALKS